MDKKINKKTKKKMSAIVMVYLAVMLMLSVGTTLALLATFASPIKNTFIPSEVTSEVKEVRNDDTKKDVKIQNTGDTESYIRAKIIITWKNEKGEVYSEVPVDKKDYTITGTHSNWILAKDGFYYWTKAVKSDDEDANNCTTENLISECKPVSGRAPEGYFLNVEIIGSGIQAFPDHVVEDEWSNDLVKIDANNGTLTITNK